MKEIYFVIEEANLELLHEEMAEQIPTFRGITTNSKGIFAVVEDEPNVEEQVHTIAALHNPNNFSSAQIVLAQTVDADVRMKNIPGWASWNEQQVIDFIESDVVDLDSAKTVLVSLARLVVALRDKEWPNLVS